MKKKLLLLILLVSCFGCVSEQFDTISEAEINQKTVSLKGIESDVAFYQPIGMNYYSDKIIVQDVASDKVLTLVDWNEMAVDTLIGSKGDGPNEFNNQFIFEQNKSNNPGPLLCFNSRDKAFYDYRIELDSDKNIKSTSLEPYSQSFTDLKQIIQNYSQARDNTIIYTDNYDHKLSVYTKYSNINNLSFSKDELEVVDQNQDELRENKISILNGYISTHRDKDNVIYASRHLGYIEIFKDYNDLSSSKLVFVGASYRERMSLLDRNITSPNFYFLDIVNTKDFIYGLYVSEKGERIASLDENIKPKLLKFDYNLKLIASYELDKFIGSMVIDENKKELVGINYGNQKLNLVKYKL